MGYFIGLLIAFLLGAATAHPEFREWVANQWSSLVEFVQKARKR